METSESGFSKIRSFFWPIHRHELVKFLPMLLLFFLVSFNYHFLRITKDSLVLTSTDVGAEILPFLKLWAMLPFSLIMIFLFTRVANKFNRENIFYIMISVFLVFFLIFILFLYPKREMLYCTSLSQTLHKFLPPGLNGFIAIIKYWMFSLYYVMAESWSTIAVSILIWGFANDVVNVKEAKRFYALFGIGINSAGILAGKCGSFLSTYIGNTKTNIHPIATWLGAKSSWDQTLIIFVGTILVNGIIIMGIYKWLHIYIFPKHRLQKNITTNKTKQSLRRNIKYVLKSKYLVYILTIVLSYNVVTNLTEVLWKSQIKAYFPHPGDLTNYLSKVTFSIGITATIASYLVSGNIIRKLGWKVAAYITPIIIIFTGIGFFYFLFLKQYAPQANNSIMLLGMTPMALAVFFGSLQNCLSRTCKYTVFDDTKEMAFIPLCDESKIRGKSAIDGIGSRLGKAGSSLIMQILLIFCNVTSACAPFILGIIILIIPFWSLSIKLLGNQFEKISKDPDSSIQPDKLSPAKSTSN